MIDEIYIKEAKRIRFEYLNNLVYISNEEENIQNLTLELNQIKEDVENSDKKSDTYYKDALFEVEKLIKKTTDKIIPFHKKIKELDKDQRNLYNNIKEKYPKLSDDDIKNYILPYIIEIDKQFKNKLKTK